MQVIVSAQETRQRVEEGRLRFRRIAFVPTMGALHEGHCSLIRCAVEGTGGARADFRPLRGTSNAAKGTRSDRTRPLTVASIFVNPTQFNSPDDLAKYPRTLEADLKLCEKEGVDLVFTPTANEIYPEGPVSDVPVPAVGRSMEGEFRPGHFAGVCAAVKRLFAIVRPDVALFGEKDFQQVRVIEEMVKEQKIPVEIVRCPTVRDENGLALSSRNRRLSAAGYEQALAIPRAIRLAQAIWRTGPVSPACRPSGRGSAQPYSELSVRPGARPEPPVLQAVKQELSGLKIDYVTIAEDRIFIAAWVEGVRLIDNDCL